MCNLYRLTHSADEVAKLFGAIAQDVRVIPGNATSEVYPGYPGLVLAEGAVRPMAWGFPLALTGAKGQPLKPKPVNNARSDKLASPFWSASFRARRCLIPLNAYAEAEGPKGAMTRTWFSPPDSPMMAVAGLWRDTAEWGAAYAMVMTGANEQAAAVHHRMPLILDPDDWSGWLGGDPQAALALCRPYAGALTVTRTDVPWAARR